MSKTYQTYKGQANKFNRTYEAGFNRGVSDEVNGLRNDTDWLASDSLGRGYRAGWTAARKA